MGTNGNGGQQVFEEIMLHQPPAMRIQHGRILTDKVRFDKENPRLKYRKEMFPDKTESDLLFEDADTNWLLKDIAEKGMLDAVYVRSAADDDTYIVVEGNRRTAVMQRLYRENPDNPMYAYMPVRILPKNTSEEQEAILMASFHVAGKVKWAAHEKAGHIWHMIHKLHIPETQLANTLHMAVPTIRRTAESYDLLEKFKRIDGGKYSQDAEGKWSFFAGMLMIKEFRNLHAESQDFSDRFCRWVGDKRLPRAENVRELARILEDKEAEKIFRTEAPEKAFEKAKASLNKSDPATNSKFFAQLKKAISAGKAATLTDIDIAAGNDAGKELLLDAHGVITNLMERANVRVPGTPRRVA